jgi:hypothetical protein
MSLIIPDEFLQTAHISEADLKLEIGRWFSLMIRITPNTCDTRIAALWAINRRDPCPQGVSSIFPIRVNQCRFSPPPGKLSTTPPPIA